jgi:acyl transferase domain-containing protein
VHGHRAVVTGTDRDELLVGLIALAAGESPRGVTVGSVPAGGAGRVGFLFSGQGSQRAGMAAGLYAASPVFAAAFDAAAGLLEDLLGVPVTEVALGTGPDPVADPRADQTLYAQPSLFAVQAGLVALLAACGITPDAVAGHSVGEVAAAYTAGVLSLQDACALVAARARGMQALPGGGAMCAIAAPEAEVATVLADTAAAGQVSIAAVNGPAAVVVSGDEDAVRGVAEVFAARGARTRMLRASHAFHSARMDPVLTELDEASAALPHAAPRITWAGALDGSLVTDPDPGYWAAAARRPVRFADALGTLAAEGVRVFIEIGPDGTLSALGSAALEQAADGPVESGPVVGGAVVEGAVAEGRGTMFIPLLRPGAAAPGTVTAAMARAHVAGARVEWAAVVPRAGRVELPTYAFQHEHYWARGAGSFLGDIRSAGLDPTGHPLLGAVVELAAGEGLVCTGRLSLRDQPWLGDHAVGDVVLLPATAFMELAVVAGYRVGCASLEELTLGVPLILPPKEAVQVQVTVGGPDDEGRRTVEVHARPDGATSADVPWTRHAAGVLVPSPASAVGFPVGDFTAWPPPDAEPVEVSGLYEALAAEGFRYGPAFRGLRAAWRRGDDIFAEVGLTAEADGGVGLFGLHPALLDAALHAVALAAYAGPGRGEFESGTMLLPFAWVDTVLYAAGASTLRVRLSVAPDDSLTLIAADGSGAPVISVGSLSRRSAGRALKSPGSAVHDALFGVTWIPLPADDLPLAAPAGPGVSAAVRTVVIGPDPLSLAAGLADAAVPVTTYPGTAELIAAVRAGEPVPDAVLVSTVAAVPAAGSAAGTGEAARQAVGRFLPLLQQLLAEEELTTARLVVVTSGAVAAAPADAVSDLAGAAVCGLVRSAQSEDPGRIVLADLLPQAVADRAVMGLLPAALRTGEPELAVRGSAVYARRLARPEPPATTAEDTRHWPPDAGTVLVTGGTGGLGGLTARHLADTGSPGRVILTSRSGPAAPGAAELAAAVAVAGTAVQITACDAADRPALAALLAGVPADCPLTAVIHTAGVLDDGVISSLTPARIDTVMRPKTDAAWHLHELTASAPLRSFILFSSAAATFGAAGQGNYAAANAFLDALAGYRRAAGLPATSLAWGLWDGTAGMGSRLSADDRSRIGRATAALAPREGLTLLDLAGGRDEAQLVPVKLSLANLRATAWAGIALPPFLRHLVPAPRRAAQAGPGSSGPPLRERLAVADAAEQDQIIADLVRGETAAVLGHSSADAIGLDISFPEQGLDSLTAIELRNRLNAATGLRLPGVAAFDFPTPAALARQMRAQLAATVTPVAGGASRPGGGDGTGLRYAAAGGESADGAGSHSLSGLYTEAVRTGRAAEILPLLSGLAGFRPTFAGMADMTSVPAPVLLSRGPQTPAVMFFSSYFGRSGIGEYARLAQGFRGVREVSAIPEPGFARGEPLPATIDALISVQAEIVLRSVGDHPVVLAGHSSGGMVAHAVAARLASAGIMPAGLVLIDTLSPEPGSLSGDQWSALVNAMLDNSRADDGDDEAWITAMLHYFAFDWTSMERTGTPTFLVRAADSLGGPAAKDSGTSRSWEFSSDVTAVDVPGDHFTMLGDHAGTTAQAINQWLAGL